MSPSQACRERKAYKRMQKGNSRVCTGSLGGVVRRERGVSTGNSMRRCTEKDQQEPDWVLADGRGAPWRVVGRRVPDRRPRVEAGRVGRRGVLPR